MEKSADWISRRAGFGFRLGDDPISENQWFTNARKSIENNKSYISNNRIKPLLKSIRRGLSDEHRKIYSGITLNQTAGIVYRKQLEKEEKQALKDQEDPDRVFTLKAQTMGPLRLFFLQEVSSSRQR